MPFFHVSRHLRPTLAAMSFTVLGACGGDSPGGPSADDWTLVWSDEFNGPAGTLPAAANWQFDIGTDWGNAQLEWTTDRPENVSTDGNGHLAITARRESFNGRSYTSARIKTQDRFEQRYGRFEARIKLPVGQGIWPAFWMLGADFDEVGWPQTGEIDIMEYRGQNPNQLLGTVHGPGYSGGSAIGTTWQLPEGRLDTDFRIYAVEWSADRIVWYLDDQAFFTVSPDDLPGPWVFDDPFFLILNVAVGGNFVGAPNASTNFPQTMLVDYVRVYERAR